MFTETRGLNGLQNNFYLRSGVWCDDVTVEVPEDGLDDS